MARRRRVVGRGGRGRLGLGRGGEVEERSLSRVVDAAFAAGPEEIASEQGQGLGEGGVLLLEAVVIGGGLIEDAFELADAAPARFGPLVLGLDLAPERVVAPEQVGEEPPAFGRIIGDL
jgi:hypothetical protein